MKNQANRFGEIDVSKNNIVYSMPVNRFKTEDRDRLESLYKQKLHELGYSEYFAFANSISELRAHFLFDYEMKDCVSFMSIRKLKFEEVIPLLQGLVEIAKISEEKQFKILWSPSNFFINMGERHLQVLLFEFEGMDIFSNKSSLDGLKELIILSLTSLLHVIVKKPSKIDFIEKREEAYQFIEDILKTKTVSDIEQVITHSLVMIEIAAEKEYEKSQEKKQIGWRKKKTTTPEKEKTTSLSDKLKKELHEERQNGGTKKYKEKKTFLDKLTSPLGVAMLIPLVLVVMTAYFLTDGFTHFTNDTTAAAQIQNEEKIKEIYMMYLNGNKEKAYAALDSIGYKNLADEDQNMLIKWYLEQKKYSKAITVNEKSAYQVGDLLAEQANTADLEQLIAQTEAPVLKFDLASVTDDYSGVIANKEIEDYNKRRAFAVAAAYYLTNNAEDLETFITEFEKTADGSEEKLIQIETLQKAQSTLSTYYEKVKAVELLIEEKKQEILEAEQALTAETATDTKKEKNSDKITTLSEALKTKESELEAFVQQRTHAIQTIKDLK